MNQRLFGPGFLKVCFFLAVSITSLLHAQVAENPYLPSFLPDRIVLNVTADPSTSMAVNWRTAESVSESFAEIAVA